MNATGDRTEEPSGLGRYLNGALALLSLGAGVIHFGVSAEHYDLTWWHGLFFAMLAWLQIAWAVALVLRPSRGLHVAGLGNLAVIGVWALSRTAGLPIGPDAGEAEPIAFADVLATAFEGAIVVGCLALLARPALAERPVPAVAARPALGTAGLAVVALSALSFTPSLAAEHGHDESADGGHGHDDTASAAAADHAHAETETEAAAEGNGHGHGEATAFDVRFGTVTDPENLRAGAKPGTDAEGSGHGHSGPSPHYFVEDPAERQLLASQLDVARKAAMALPTAAAAKAAGYRQVTPYVPLIGAHWMNFDYVDGTFEPDKPEMVLYDGNGPDAKVVGLSYYALTTPEAPPEGFVSPNDSWHQHIGLCIANGRVVGDVDTSTADCKARGGEKVKLDNAWMNHAWVVPGWESAWGTFSAENPDLR